jgi:hypothetical protein
MQQEQQTLSLITKIKKILCINLFAYQLSLFFFYFIVLIITVYYNIILLGIIGINYYCNAHTRDV